MKKQKRSNRQSRNLSGFTLVELLLVIAIISVLAAMSLGVLRNAQDSAKSAATQARITQIEALLAIQLEDYEVRRLPISNRELADYVRANPAKDEDGDNVKVFVQLQALRRQILMDIINSEFPRPYIDAQDGFRLNPDVGQFPSDIGPVVGAAETVPFGDEPVGFRTWLETNYMNPVNETPLSERLDQLKTSAIRSLERFNPDPDNADAGDPFNLPGEYLYAVLERLDVDGTPAVELLGNAIVGNVDGDQFSELIDAWGEPLQLRIWQVDSMPNLELGAYDDGVSSVINEDVEELDFDLLDAEGVPTGYVGLDPQIPREIRKIRFEVVSTRMARDQGVTGFAVQDPR